MSNEKPSPIDVKKVVEKDDKQLQRLNNDRKRIRQEGFDEGFEKGRTEILGWLQKEYTGPNAPDRDSPRGEAIIQLARDFAKHVRGRR